MSTITETLDNAAREHKNGNFQQAEQLYQIALKNNPDNPFALHSLGILVHQKGRSDTALEFLKRAITSNGQIPQLHNSLGLVYESLGKLDDAIISYQQAISLEPNYAEAYHNMAITLQSQGRYATAIEKCKKAISFRPDYAEAYNTMAFSLQNLERNTEAIENYKQAIKHKPDFAEAYNHLGVLLNQQGRSLEAVEYFKKALQFDPEYAELYNNLGIALKEQEHFEEAMMNFEQAIKLEPNFAEAFYNMANSLRDQGRCNEAIEKYREAIRLKPDYIDAQWNMSLAYLLNGNYELGWNGYKQWRNARLKRITDRRCPGKPRWDGSSFANKRLLIHYEQGLGDNIQFARYLPMVKALGGTVILETLEPLTGLFRSFSGIDELLVYEHNKQPSVQFDLYTSLFDLPSIFQTTLETIPAKVPYIHADPAKVRSWRDRITGPDFKVGIVWAGSPVHGNDRYRSCPLDYFEPLSKIDGVQLYSLQKGPATAQMDLLAGKISVTNISNHLEDFSDTAAAIENLDLVISVDTSVLHLAGAMGKPAWAVLPFAPEWRWMLDRTDSPWYPTMKLFRQKQWGQWEPVFEEVAQELRNLTANRKLKIENLCDSCQKKETIPVIIPGYKNKSQLDKCIAHLKNQTRMVEIFVRDNNENNINFTAAVNEGIIRYLSWPCKYILILNQDMYLEPGAVEKMEAFMDTHPECGIGAPLQFASDNRNYVIFAGGCEAFPAGKHQHGPLSEFTEDKQISWCNGACMILRTEMIQHIGLLDDNFTFIGSDSDYCFTARSRGWQVWRIAAAGGTHEQGVSAQPADLETELLKVQDMIYFGKKWLTGQLYKELAHETENCTTESVEKMMANLCETEVELKRIRNEQRLNSVPA